MRSKSSKTQVPNLSLDSLPRAEEPQSVPLGKYKKYSPRGHKYTSLYDMYFHYQAHYTSLYGSNTVVWMEVGSFRNIFGYIDVKGQEVGMVTRVCQSTGWAKSKAGTQDDPWQIGCNMVMTDKWRERLEKDGYKLVMVDVTNPEAKKSTQDLLREVTHISGEAFDTTQEGICSRHIMSIRLEKLTDFKTKRPIICAGMAILDMITGQPVLHEAVSTVDDYAWSIDEVYRTIQVTRPVEILIHVDGSDALLTQDALQKQLEINADILQFNFYKKQPELLKPKFMVELLETAYPKQKSNMTHIFHNLGIDQMELSQMAFVHLLYYCYEHSKSNIKALNLPKVWEPTKHLILTQDSVRQLNVMTGIDGKKGVWDLLDKTQTTLGRRCIRDRLTHPVFDTSILNERYQLVDWFQKTPKDLLQKKGETTVSDRQCLFITVQSFLKGIIDVERLHRRLERGLLTPQEFSQLHHSYGLIRQLVQWLSPFEELEQWSSIRLSQDDWARFQLFQTRYTALFCLEQLDNDFEKIMFQSKQLPDLDTQVAEKVKQESYFDKVRDALILRIFKDYSNSMDRESIALEQNEKEVFLRMSHGRSKSLKASLKADPHVVFFWPDPQSKQCIAEGDFKWTAMSSNVKLYSSAFDDASVKWVAAQERIRSIQRQHWNRLLNEFSAEFGSVLSAVSQFISQVDAYASIARVAKELGYCRPEIVEGDRAMINAKQLRHPIVEQLDTKVPYVPNDVLLGVPDQQGILLYGSNCVGKSTLMKSIGLAVILAQSGFFVPAQQFQYTPYKHLFTRISKNDDLHKGLSTFGVELEELGSIYKRANASTLVLGDELCSGTEMNSAIAIFTTGVEWLLQTNASFIFTTHFHVLKDQPELQTTGVQFYHMDTKYDPVSGKLTYLRQLLPGPGDALYGIECAKAASLPESFLAKAEQIRRRLLGQDELLPISIKTSKYNAKLIVDKCAVCGQPASDVHHVKEQHTANEAGLVDHRHKNHLSNLTTLCESCHQKTHHGDLTIVGHVQTSQGVELIIEKPVKKRRAPTKNLKKKSDLI